MAAVPDPIVGSFTTLAAKLFGNQVSGARVIKEISMQQWPKISSTLSVRYYRSGHR